LWTPSPHDGAPAAHVVLGEHIGVHAYQQSGSTQPTRPSPSTSKSAHAS
jgi:hypothetical protein